MRKISAMACLLTVLSVLAACGQAAQPEVAPQVVTQVVEKVVTQVAEVEKIVTQVVEVEKEVIVTATPEAGVKRLLTDFGPGDVPTIDPALGTDTSSIQIVTSTYVGLTRQDEETSEIGPGMATEWDISEDGTTYTFKLRDDIPWVRYNAQTGEVEQVVDAEGNERMVTCADFEYGIERTLTPSTASDYAYVLYPLVGAEEFNTADTATVDEAGLTALQEGVGVTCTDETTLELTIKQPAAYFPAIAGMWMANAQPQWIIEERGDRWTEPGFFQSYGPYTLKDWNHESDLTLIANPFWPGTDNIPQPKITELTFLMLDQTPAFANYETGELDVLQNVPISELDRIRSDATLGAELNVAPNQCTYYYGFNVTKPPFDDANVRRAFGMAIDRTSIVENVTKGGQEPARWFIRPGLAAAPDPEKGDDFGMPVTADPEQAKELIAASKYGSIEALPPVTLMYNQSEAHARIAEAVQQMIQENLGVEIQLSSQEWKVYLETLDQDAPHMFRLAWCADYSDANNFAELFISGSGNNDTNWSNEEYDRLVAEAAIEADPERRHELYIESEKILVEEEAAITPIYWYTGVRLTKPYVTRTYSVLGGVEQFEKWDIERP